MTAQGRQGAGVRPLILKGLEVAEQGDLRGALKRWQIAFQLDPTSRAAQLLVDLTEAFVEATSTGITLPAPDFRAHLHDIGFDADEPSGPVRAPGDSKSGVGKGGRGAKGGPWTPGGSTRVTARAQMATTGEGSEPGSPPPSSSDVGRTAYGLPLREQRELGSRMDPIRGAWEAETTPPAVPALPRGARSEGGGQLHTTPQGLPLVGGRSVSTAGVAEDDSSDPWADLGSELADVPSEDWTLPPDEGEPSPSPGTSSDSQMDPLVAPAWDVSDGVDLDLSALDEPKTGRVEAGKLAESSGSPLSDPFAVLDDGSRGSGSRPNTAPGVRFARGEESGPAGGEGSSSGAGASGRRRSTGAERAVPGHSAPSGRKRAKTEPMYGAARDDDELLPPPLESDQGAGPGPRPRASGGRIEGRPVIERYSGPRAAVGSGPKSGKAIGAPVARPDGSAGVGPPPRDTFDRQALWERARQQHSLGDFASSQKLLEEILSRNPDDSQARKLLEEGRTQREKRDLARLRSLDATPRLVLGQEQLVWQNLDAKKGFVLSRVDGISTIRDIIDLVNLPRQETIQILADLVDEGILRMT